MKKIVAIMALVWVMVANQSFAHTALESSMPSDGEIVTEPLQNLILKYATKIENGSTFQLKNSQGEMVDIDVVVEHDVLKGTAASPLPNDQYTLDWSIIGADGHPIQGSLAFEMNVVQEETEQIVEETEEVEINEAPKVENNEEKEVKEETAETSSSFPVALIIILVVIALGSFVFLRKRKG